MLSFIVGCFFGAIVGFTVAAMCVVARDADDDESRKGRK